MGQRVPKGLKSGMGQPNDAYSRPIGSGNGWKTCGTYLPQIGLYLVLTWAVMELCAGRRYGRPVPSVVAAVVIGTLSVDAFAQTSYWRDNESLWNHTLDCTTNNGLAHADLGLALLQKGRMDEAIIHFH